jgi:hypothetical protein
VNRNQSLLAPQKISSEKRKLTEQVRNRVHNLSNNLKDHDMFNKEDQHTPTQTSMFSSQRHPTKIASQNFGTRKSSF